jgi:hypothetical protein
VDFTREPIIETVITPREGYRLVIRSSKNVGQEEHFVDAVEVISFGNALFFRSLERPKPFIVPLSDYEVLEVREPRMVLKTSSLEGSVKIGGGRDSSFKGSRDQERQERKEASISAEKEREQEPQQPAEMRPVQAAQAEGRGERRRDRRRSFRKRRGSSRDESASPDAPSLEEQPLPIEVDERVEQPLLSKAEAGSEEDQEAIAKSMQQASTLLSSVLPPPTTLIRDDLARLRSNELYKGAFYIREDKDSSEDDDDDEASVEPFGMQDDFDSGEYSSETGGYSQYQSSESQQGAFGGSPEDPFCVTPAQGTEKPITQEAEPDVSSTTKDVD